MEVRERWREYFDHALNFPPTNTTTPSYEDQTNLVHTMECGPPSAPEITKALRKLKNGRSAGQDGIVGEYLRKAEGPVSSALLQLFTKIWEVGKVPQEWKVGVILPLYKGKGSRTSCGNYRPITLLSVPGKVLSLIILDRITPTLLKARRPQQSGFTPGRSTADAILALRLVAEICRNYSQPLNVAYVDIKAAFDSVDRSKLWYNLASLGIPEVMISLIKDLHTDTSARVRVGNELSPAFPTTSGVKQGCVLAPALFCTVMDHIMNKCQNTLGKKIGDHIHTDLLYADDAVLYVKDNSLWHQCLTDFQDAAGFFGLRPSWTKTKIQSLASGPEPTSLSVGAEMVEAVKSFKYLGSVIHSDGRCTPEIRRRIGMASSTMGQLSRVWNQQRLATRTKIRIFRSCVLSVLLYGSETWTLQREDERRLNAFSTTSQRRILGIRWYHRVSNTDVLQTTGVEPVADLVAVRKHSLFGHVRRLDPRAPAHAALQQAVKTTAGQPPCPGWRRPRGRPRKSWIGSLMVGTGLSAEEGWIAATDRGKWKALRPLVGQARK